MLATGASVSSYTTAEIAVFASGGLNRVTSRENSQLQFISKISGGSKNFEREGGGRQFITPVLIYRKCAQRSIGLYTEKDGFFEKKV